MSLGPVPGNADITVKGGHTTPAWLAWLSALYGFVKALGQNGATATRPTIGLYVGQAFFDTTLGFPVWVKTSGPPGVWVRYDGTVV